MKKTMHRIVTNKNEADFYLSKGATLFYEKKGKYYFDADDTRTMKLEWKYIKNREKKIWN